MDSFLGSLSKLEAWPKLKRIPMSVYDHLAKRPGGTDVVGKVEEWFRKAV